MSTLKTKVDEESVRQVLKNCYDTEIKNFSNITGGELSAAFSYRTNNKAYVIRINSDSKGFFKDDYAFKHFSSYGIPIPETHAVEQFDEDYWYSITDRMPGKTLDQIEESTMVIDSVIATLDVIHEIPVVGKKYGDWDASGEASHNTWREHLLALLEENQRDSDSKNYADWFELAVVRDLTDQFVKLVEYCPEHRHLLHADFESGNTLSDGHSITGVIDWANAKYGDPVFDIAWIDFWKEHINYKGFFKQYIQDKGRDVKNYEERVVCYTLYFGIGALFFFSKSNQRGSYEWTKNRLLQIVYGTKMYHL